MPLQETLQALYALQQIDSQIQRTKRAQAALDNGAQAASQAEAAHDAARQKRETWHKAAADLKDSELKLKALEDKRKNYQQKLYQGTVTNSRELANIEKEIGALGRQRGDLDERILALMESVERLQEESQLADAQAQQAEAHRANGVAAFQSQYEAYKLELTELTRRRAEAAAHVDNATLLKRYEDIRAKSGGIGIAKIIDNSCGGCHMTLPSGLIKSVKEGAAPHTCDNCGRLLTV